MRTSYACVYPATCACVLLISDIRIALALAKGRRKVFKLHGLANQIDHEKEK